MPVADYELVCGMEIHIELKTASKMFCGCKNDPFHAPLPNMYTCPVCLGLPGALPVPNKRAIEWTVQLGMALGCTINTRSKFDRKHYFYPDLPKGFQLSQYDRPFCINGQVDTLEGPVCIRRIHLEEDTAKLVHREVEGEKVSLIDFNRSGVALLEIVTEPDIVSGSHAKEYGKAIRALVRYLQIADGDMERGGMRLEANVSLRKKGASGLPDYKVELKNINSFRFVDQAIGFEMARQAAILDAGNIPVQETRGYDPQHKKTYSQRVKEEAEDYRYFPEPDIPPFVFDEALLAAWRAALPELPAQVAARWSERYGVQISPTHSLLTSQHSVKLVDEVFASLPDDQPSAFFKSLQNKKLSISLDDVVNAQVTATELLAAFAQHHQQPRSQLSTDEIGALLREQLPNLDELLAQYRSGKGSVLNFLIGALVRALKQQGRQVDMTSLKQQLVQWASESLK